MLIGGIVAGLVLGLLAGGTMAHLGSVRLRFVTLLFAAVVVRFTTEAALGADLAIAELLRLPLFAIAYGMLLVGLWVNRTQPGLMLAFVGVLGNAIAIVANGGFMPIWLPSLEAAGLTRADVQTAFHTILEPTFGAHFLIHAGPLSDVIPIPFPIIQNVASMGDVFLASGLAFFLFATVVRDPRELGEEEVEVVRQRLTGLAGSARLPRSVEDAIGERRVRPETGLAPGLAEAAALERPRVLGASGSGMAAPALAPLPVDVGEAPDVDPGIGPNAYGAGGAIAIPVPRAGDGLPLPRPAVPRITDRARRHPYVRLALNGSFSALWMGQLISLFGDRIHQIALGFLVYGATESPLAVALVFLAATLPNLLFSPLAGTLVDRWDQKEILVVSDLLRASAVLLVPMAAVINLWLVYPLSFAITTISIFFRPARVAVLPRIVRDDELLTANSALWVGETMADVVGYPLAGLFVGFLGPALALAFWLDAATYAASALLIATIVVPPVRRRAETASAPNFRAELHEGWRFLRGETVLLANTLQATVAQFTIGILTALTLIYASEVIRGTTITPQAVYAFLETGVGFGNLVGGFLLGLLGARLARGRLVIVGYTVSGLCTAALALTDNLTIAIGLMIGLGVANMIFLIPSQTLFQERTPPELMGRVVGFRFSLVFGSMTLAMGVGGVLAQAVGVPIVLGVFGLLTAAAGFAGLFVPAVRDA